ncbi:MAG: hypothetical protein M1830_009823 [Pleopsidium flavum]|nr:MAG: hypothetical protein M1830_009823 [Pleopsidium flavum]
MKKRTCEQELTPSKASFSPFAVPTLENYHVLVSSETQIKELSEAPETQLSLHAIAKDLFAPEHTMYGFVVHDQMSANGSMHFRVLRTLLTSNLPLLQPDLYVTLKAATMTGIQNAGIVEDGISPFKYLERLQRT